MVYIFPLFLPEIFLRLIFLRLIVDRPWKICQRQTVDPIETFITSFRAAQILYFLIIIIF